MNCEEFDNRLDALLDQRRPLELEDELAAHAGDCPFCARQWESYDALVAGVRELPRLSVSPGLARRVVAELNAPEAPVQAQLVELDVSEHAHAARPRRWVLWIAPVATAAAALVGIALLVQGLSHDESPAGVDQVAERDIAPAPLAERSAPAPAEGLPAGRALALYRVTGRMAEELAAGQTALVEPMTDRFNRFKPMTESIPAVFEAFRKSMPSPHQRAQDS